jgi:hypothetical protein
MDEFALRVSMVTMILAFLTVTIGSIWFYVEAFKESVGWFLACLLLPFATIIFLFMKPEKAFWPTATIFLGVFFFFMARLMI